jgi:hypothetical protein
MGTGASAGTAFGTKPAQLAARKPFSAEPIGPVLSPRPIYQHLVNRRSPVRDRSPASKLPANRLILRLSAEGSSWRWVPQWAAISTTRGTRRRVSRQAALRRARPVHQYPWARRGNWSLARQAPRAAPRHWYLNLLSDRRRAVVPRERIDEPYALEDRPPNAPLVPFTARDRLPRDFGPLDDRTLRHSAAFYD